MSYPIAYHITWGTYGARLPGTDRPHIDRDHNQYGAPLAPANPARESSIRGHMSFPPVLLTLTQRHEVRRAIDDVAGRYKWKIHNVAVQQDHVHVVITAPRDGQNLRDALKAVAARSLNKAFGKREWWAEKGSAKYLFEQDYFEAAIAYVERQREF
jgi:REP element-mobilizing transposase RayT